MDAVLANFKRFHVVNLNLNVKSKSKSGARAATKHKEGFKQRRDSTKAKACQRYDQIIPILWKNLSCIVATVFTWDYETAAPVWEALKSQPVLSDEIQAFKALISMHKIIRDGHKSALIQAIRDINFLDLLGRAARFNSHGIYSGLIDAYIGFLRYKLEFHSIHPEFTANMDYEEYRALRKVDDPNEG